MRHFWQRALALLVLGTIWLTGTARAQTTTGTLRGTVTDETGGVLPGVRIETVNDDSGVKLLTTSQASGFYNISLQPGPYTVTANLQNFASPLKRIVVQLGQTQGLDFEMKIAATLGQAMTVSAAAPQVEAKSSEVATNITERQLQQLPQDGRNFLNFANLAPGVRTATDENNKEIQAGALPGFNTNVFIDGTSYKNDVLNGGIVGQDSSRGNPFPQNAVQEFRVVTQNFKVEYEKSSSAIITAVTKSGGNDFHGDAFADYQNKALVATNSCDELANRCAGQPKAGFSKPDYTRWQPGLSLGGPIIKDKLHFFGSWEYNDQNRNQVVTLGDRANLLPASVRSQLAASEGNVSDPFKSNLAFGKVSWQVNAGDVVDFTGFYRHENEVKDVGGQRAFEAGTDIVNAVWNIQARNSWLSSKFLNETTVGYQDYRWNPSPVVPGIIGQDFQNVLRIGSTDNLQNFNQKRLSLRDDFTLLDLQGFGNHVVKFGAVFSHNNYDVQKQFNGTPIYRYRSDIPADSPFAFPFEASFGFGNPDLSLSNNQLGVYLQDDWTVTSRLTINVGMRWDYEPNGLDNDYVTPALVRSELGALFDAKYFSDGSARPSYKNAFQPRVGFAYDLTGKGQTIFFGGYGRYVDRVEYNALLDEKFRLQYTTLTFRFSADGLPRDGQPTLVWNPAFITAAGLQGIINSGTGPKPEVFLIDNNTAPPISDQFTVGFRQQLGPVNASLSYAGVRSRNGYTWIFGNRNPDGSCCRSLAPDFGNVLLSDASKRAWYDALFLQVDKAYTVSSKWGATLAYTYGHATANGGDFFSLDYLTPADYPRHRAPQDERHRIVISGIVGLPWNVRLSTLLTLGTGVGFTIQDSRNGFGFNQQRINLNEGTPTGGGTFPFQAWDISLQKDFYVTETARVGARAGVFNVTNHNNYGCYDGFIAPKTDPAPNANFGTPSCLVTQPRRLQVGLNVGF